MSVISQRMPLLSWLLHTSDPSWQTMSSLKPWKGRPRTATLSPYLTFATSPNSSQRYLYYSLPDHACPALHPQHPIFCTLHLVRSPTILLVTIYFTSSLSLSTSRMFSSKILNNRDRVSFGLTSVFFYTNYWPSCRSLEDFSIDILCRFLKSL